MACKCKDCKCGEMTNEKVIEQMDDQRKPYTEKVYASFAFDTEIRERHFDKTAPEHLFKWHWDEEDRWVEAIYENDWKFQFKDEDEISLTKDLELEIPANKFHKLIKGTTDLVVKIQIGE